MAYKILNKISISFLSAIFFLIINNDSYSYPKFAALTGDKCLDCHVNPTGGGMRQRFSKKFLYMKMFEKANDSVKFDPQISEGIRLGADMRLMYLDDQAGEGSPNINSFFQMQGDLYVNAKINKYLSLMIAPGLYIPNTFGPNPLATKYEIYGMVSNLPAGLYFKVGRFIPNFGIKIPEHRAYQRDLNGFYTPYASDAGIEVGISPTYFTLTAELSNGQSRNKDGLLNNSFDFDAQKQITVFGDFRWAQKDRKYTFGLGGSFITNPFKYDFVNNINALRQIGAGFFSIGLFDRVAILGEVDYNRLQIRDSAGTKNDFKTFFGELDIRVIQGVEAKFQFEAYDPNLGFKGPNERRRYSFGVMLFPLTGLEIESIFRLVKEPGLNDDEQIKNNEYQTVFKFYF
jgi:hypothetical protein